MSQETISLLVYNNINLFDFKKSKIDLSEYFNRHPFNHTIYAKLLDIN